MSSSFWVKLYLLTVPLFFVVDIAWGSALCAIVATGAFLIGKRLS